MVCWSHVKKAIFMHTLQMWSWHYAVDYLNVVISGMPFMANNSLNSKMISIVLHCPFVSDR